MVASTLMAGVGISYVAVSTKAIGITLLAAGVLSFPMEHYFSRAKEEFSSYASKGVFRLLALGALYLGVVGIGVGLSFGVEDLMIGNKDARSNAVEKAKQRIRAGESCCLVKGEAPNRFINVPHVALVRGKEILRSEDNKIVVYAVEDMREETIFSEKLVNRPDGSTEWRRHQHLNP